jgi:CRISPR-associated protein Csc2
MTTLNDLKKRQDLFFDAIPQLPMGRYVHFVLLRETESFPIFQTDGTLNVIRMQAGLKDEALISRLVMFKRKQSSPERLKGRELLRYYGVINYSGDRACTYNPNTQRGERTCKSCPDCIHYGYAVGNEGAEKAKVYVDSAFSITFYEESHKSFSFNALDEGGTMWDPGTERPRQTFGEHDHIVPQVFFPAIVTLRDPTHEGFLYVLGNILRTDRYGATDTRTGKVKNHPVAVVFANGEVFSNLRYTQAIYDHLKEKGQWSEPLVRESVLKAGESVYAALIAQEPVVRMEELVGDKLTALLAEAQALYQDEAQTKALLEALDAKTRKYAEDYGAAKS